MRTFNQIFILSFVLLSGTSVQGRPTSILDKLNPTDIVKKYIPIGGLGGSEKKQDGDCKQTDNKENHGSECPKDEHTNECDSDEHQVPNHGTPKEKKPSKGHPGKNPPQKPYPPKPPKGQHQPPKPPKVNPPMVVKPQEGQKSDKDQSTNPIYPSFPITDKKSSEEECNYKGDKTNHHDLDSYLHDTGHDSDVEKHQEERPKDSLHVPGLDSPDDEECDDKTHLDSNSDHAKVDETPKGQGKPEKSLTDIFGSHDDEIHESQGDTEKKSPTGIGGKDSGNHDDITGKLGYPKVDKTPKGQVKPDKSLTGIVGSNKDDKNHGSQGDTGKTDHLTGSAAQEKKGCDDHHDSNLGLVEDTLPSGPIDGNSIGVNDGNKPGVPGVSDHLTGSASQGNKDCGDKHDSNLDLGGATNPLGGTGPGKSDGLVGGLGGMTSGKDKNTPVGLGGSTGGMTSGKDKNTPVGLGESTGGMTSRKDKNTPVDLGESTGSGGLGPLGDAGKLISGPLGGLGPGKPDGLVGGLVPGGLGGLTGGNNLPLMGSKKEDCNEETPKTSHHSPSHEPISPEICFDDENSNNTHSDDGKSGGEKKD